MHIKTLKDLKLSPDHVKRMVDYAERKKLGIETYDELSVKTERFLEKKLHGDIIQLLNYKGIAYGHARMDRKSSYTVGWPDFTFSVSSSLQSFGISCAWECKVLDRKLSTDQEEMKRKMETPPNAWRYRVIRSQQEACDELKELGV